VCSEGSVCLSLFLFSKGQGRREGGRRLWKKDEKQSMNIVFLTPDRIVDRRIVLEAESLRMKGYTPCIIADLGAGKASDESYPGIPIVNALMGGTEGAPARKSLFTMLKDPAKRLLGSSPGLRKCFRTTYFYLFHVAQLARPPSRRRLYPLEDAYYERARAMKADIYVACDLPMLSPAARAARDHGSLLIYDAHEFYTGQVTLSGPERAMAEAFERELIGKAQLVITVNESIAALFAERYGVRKPEVIYNCTSAPPSFDREVPHRVIREKCALDDTAKIVLFQGGYLPGRNLENLVRAAGSFRDGIVLVLLGFGEYGAHLQDIARGVGRGKVFFLEAVSQGELLEHSASADLGVIPYEPIDLNTRFCTPNKFFEFIQAGLPVLAEKRLEELKLFVEREEVGFLRDLSTPGSIAAAVNEICSQSASLVRAKERCGAIAGRYSWDEEGARFAAMVENIIAGARR